MNALELMDVRKHIGSTEILRGVNLTVAQGEKHAIIGPNGAGKSTLYNLITAQQDVTSGDIRINGETVVDLTPHQVYRKGLARSFQVTNVFPKMSVFENLRCGLFWSMGYKYSFWHNVDKLDAVNNKAQDMLDFIGLSARAHVPAGVLTYAEQRALEIGITTIGGASVIILDEPTAGLSRHEIDREIELIQQLTVGKTLVIIEHDMSVVFDLAERISVLVDGEVIVTAEHAEIRGNARVREAYLGKEAGFASSC